MIFRDHFGYRRHAREIHGERIALEKAAHRGFSSIALTDAIELLAIAVRVAGALRTALPPPFRAGGIIAPTLEGGEPIIPQRSGVGAGQVPARTQDEPATRLAP